MTVDSADSSSKAKADKAGENVTNGHLTHKLVVNGHLDHINGHVEEGENKNKVANSKLIAEDVDIGDADQLGEISDHLNSPVKGGASEKANDQERREEEEASKKISESLRVITKSPLDEVIRHEVSELVETKENDNSDPQEREEEKTSDYAPSVDLDSKDSCEAPEATENSQMLRCEEAKVSQEVTEKEEALEISKLWLDSSRPERRCKRTTKTLVALSLEEDDDPEDDDVEDDPEDDKPLKAMLDKRRKRSSEEEKAKNGVKKSRNIPRKRKKKTILTVKKKKKLPIPTRIQLPKKRGRPRKISEDVMIKNTLSDLKIKDIFDSVTESDKSFKCLKCGLFFAGYHLLSSHKKSPECLRKPGIFLETPVRDSVDSTCCEEYASFVSESNQRVPETTFNQLVGKLDAIESLDAVHYRFSVSNSGNSLSAVEKVRLNLSGWWSTKDVWESGAGWEPGRDPLTWRRYDQPGGGGSSCLFLHRLSSLQWSVQKTFRDAWDKSLFKTTKEEVVSKKTLLQMLGLRQLSRFSKYTSLAERTQRGKRRRTAEEESKIIDCLSGEWELEHDFRCSVCFESFPELREVLHHKWDAHPYCLVTHVVLKKSVTLPPGGWLHPQTGRGLEPAVMPDTRWDSVWRCTKCNKGDFEGCYASFHSHVLSCGGIDLVEETRKRRRKKRRLAAAAAAEAAAAEAAAAAEGPKRKKLSAEESALRRKARFARFSAPPPTVHETGRMTRRQASMLREEEKKKRANRKRRPTAFSVGKKRKRKNANKSQKVSKKKVSSRGSPKVPTSSEVVVEQKQQQQQLNSAKPERRRASVAAEIFMEQYLARDRGSSSWHQQRKRGRCASAEDAVQQTQPAPKVARGASLDTPDDSRTCGLRQRRSAAAASSGASSGFCARLSYPEEVKVGAIERLASGETQAEVARDLQCPVSTVASWWQRRKKEQQKQTESPEVNGVSTPKEDKVCEPSKVYPLVPYEEKNAILLKMRLRVAQAFIQRSQQDEENKQQELVRPSSGLSLILDSYADEDDSS